MPETNLFLVFVERLNRLGGEYMVTGSVAGIIYGEPRLTHDVDIVVVLGKKEIAELHSIFPADQFYLPPLEVIRTEAHRSQRGHFNVIDSATGFKADFYLASRDPLHQWGLKNKRKFTLGSETIWVAPPEYVVVRKLQYFREGQSEKHLRDIRSILKHTSELINRADLQQKIAALDLESEWSRVTSSPD